MKYVNSIWYTNDSMCLISNRFKRLDNNVVIISILYLLKCNTFVLHLINLNLFLLSHCFTHSSSRNIDNEMNKIIDDYRYSGSFYHCRNTFIQKITLLVKYIFFF